MNLEELCNTNLPKTKRNNGYSAIEFIYLLVLMLHNGGRFLDDIREIRVDKALTTLLKIECLRHSNSDTQPFFFRTISLNYRLEIISRKFSKI
jgi:hypothetical protein